MSLFSSLCKPSQRPRALNLLASHLVRNKTGPKRGLYSGAGVELRFLTGEAHPGQIARGSDNPAEGVEIGALLWGWEVSSTCPQPPTPQATSVWSTLLNPLCVPQTHNTRNSSLLFRKNGEQTQVLILCLMFSAERDLSLE